MRNLTVWSCFQIVRKLWKLVDITHLREVFGIISINHVLQYLKMTFPIVGMHPPVVGSSHDVKACVLFNGTITVFRVPDSDTTAKPFKSMIKFRVVFV